MARIASGLFSISGTLNTPDATSTISFACMAIDAGQCDVAIVCLADDPKTGTRQAYEKAWGDDAAYGWFSVASGYGMIMQRHMAEFGTKPEQFGAIAMAPPVGSTLDDVLAHAADLILEVPSGTDDP